MFAHLLHRPGPLLLTGPTDLDQLNTWLRRTLECGSIRAAIYPQDEGNSVTGSVLPPAPGGTYLGKPMHQPAKTRV